MKKTENTQVDILSKKLRYKEKQRTESSFIFRKNKNNFILNKKQLVSIICINRDLFIDKIKSAYNNNIIIKQIP
jgi:hypothetical protein